MCGFTGYLVSNNQRFESSTEPTLRQRVQAIVHRGHDSDGYWADPDAGVGLANRRLAVVDLSPAGAQPMVSGIGPYLIAFTGTPTRNCFAF